MAQDRAESNYDANREMPLWVISGHPNAHWVCLLWGVKRSFVMRPNMSANDPKRTSPCWHQ